MGAFHYVIFRKNLVKFFHDWSIEEREDALHDVIKGLLRKDDDSWQNPSTFGGLLYTATKRRLIGERRLKRFTKRRNLEPALLDALSCPVPERADDESEEDVIINAFMASLKPLERQLIELRVIEKRGYAYIQSLMGGTRRQLTDARYRILKKLEQKLEEGTNATNDNMPNKPR